MYKFKLASYSAVILFSSVTFAASPDSNPVDVVAQLYRDFAHEAVIEEPDWKGHSLTDLPRVSLEKYFDHNLASLLLKDNECAAKTHEICKLDFSPMWSSQDPEGVSQLKVKQTNIPSIVEVYFSYFGNKEMIKLTYLMTRTHKGWRISDIQSDSPTMKWSLLSILKGKD